MEKLLENFEANNKRNMYPVAYYAEQSIIAERM